MEVVNMPSMEAANTGYVYMHDYMSKYVKFGKYVYRCRQSYQVKPGTIALNSIQRRSENVLLGSFVNVTKFEKTIEEFTNLHVDAEWLIRDIEMTTPDFSEIFKTYFDGHVLSESQEVVLHNQDNLIRFSVKSTHQGTVTKNTRVFITWN
jgi:hypothetical protein